MDMLTRRRGMMAEKPKSPYIGGPPGSDSYIKLPVNPASNLVIEIEWYGKFAAHPSGGYTGILVWNNSNGYGMVWNSSSKIQFYVKSWGGVLIQGLSSNPIVKATMSYPTKTLTTEQADGTIRTGTATATYNTSASYELYARINANHKFHKISVYKNNVLTHEFVAAKDENNVPCFKNTLTEDCYYDSSNVAQIYSI